MYNVFLHNILQVAINLVHLKPGKVKPFSLSFQNVHKIFSLHPLYLFLVILLSLNSSALICLISFICVLLHFKGMLITQMVMIRYDGYDKIWFHYQWSSSKSASSVSIIKKLSINIKNKNLWKQKFKKSSSKQPPSYWLHCLG